MCGDVDAVRCYGRCGARPCRVPQDALMRAAATTPIMSGANIMPIVAAPSENVNGNASAPQRMRVMPTRLSLPRERCCARLIMVNKNSRTSVAEVMSYDAGVVDVARRRTNSGI